MNGILKVLVVLVVVGIVVTLAGTLLPDGNDAAYETFTSVVSRGDIQNTITATGNVEAMVTVDVGSQVTGQVQTLYADFNSIVSQGDILARLDPRQVETQLRNSQASLRSAQSRILTVEADRANADANVASARASMLSAELELGQAELDLDRAESLFAEELVAETELERATLQLQVATARVIQQTASLEQSQAQIISRDAAVEQAYSSFQQAEADLEEAELNVSYTVITSPVDGVVISREVEVGQTVSASTSAPTLFLIANDLSRMRVEASIDEADIGSLGHDNEVTFRVDAYPRDEFRGRIEEIRLNPSRSQNVVTYSVIVTFDNPDLKLKPGMTANIAITLDHRDDVMTVPNTALRYTPPDLRVDESTTDIATHPDAAAEVGIAASGFNPKDFSSRADLTPIDESAASDWSATFLAPATASVYMPGQEWQDGMKIQFRAAPPTPPRPGVVWVMTDMGIPEPRSLMVGLTDGSRTEVISGDIREGELLLIGDTAFLGEEVPEEEEGNSNYQMYRVLRGSSGGRSPH